MTSIKNTKPIKSLIVEIWEELLDHKRSDDKQKFDKLMQSIIPSLKTYINRRLYLANKKGKLIKDNYTADEFIDILYIQAYEQISEFKQAKDLSIWLFSIIDTLLEDAIMDEEFEQFFFENIDSYSQVEWREMEEKFSIDGDGDWIMEEKLDNISYSKNDYVLKDVFVDDSENNLIDKISQSFTNKQIKAHLDMIFSLLPISAQTIYELAAKHQLDSTEISTVKKIPESKVNDILSEVRKSIVISFKNRLNQNGL